MTDNGHELWWCRVKGHLTTSRVRDRATRASSNSLWGRAVADLEDEDFMELVGGTLGWGAGVGSI